MYPGTQGFPYWGDGESPPHQPEICSFPPPGKIISQKTPPPPTKCLFPLTKSQSPPLNNKFK